MHVHCAFREYFGISSVKCELIWLSIKFIYCSYVIDVYLAAMTTLQRGSLNCKQHSYEQLVSVHEAVLKWLLCSERWVVKGEILGIEIDLGRDQHFQNILKVLILVEASLDLESLIFHWLRLVSILRVSSFIVQCSEHSGLGYIYGRP